MSNLETLAGQQAHYAGVRSRLRFWAPQPVKRKPAVLNPSLEEIDAIAADIGLPTIGKTEAPLNFLTPPSWRFLVALEALRSGYTVDEIIGKNRAASLVAARHRAIYSVVVHTKLSLASIAGRFGRDHTTVLHSLSKFPPIDRTLDAATGKPPVDVVKEKRRRVIAEGYAAAVPVTVIAAQLGISNSTVSRLAGAMNIKHPDNNFCRHGRQSQ